mmetsp:Transcript_16256/g.37489  ORF Transcript_16256/g.37489 Transcript_16256/m.37489 type:complete len:126 (+) Transcript_16256:767-1144(+)
MPRLGGPGERESVAGAAALPPLGLDCMFRRRSGSGSACFGSAGRVALLTGDRALGFDNGVVGAAMDISATFDGDEGSLRPTGKLKDAEVGDTLAKTSGPSALGNTHDAPHGAAGAVISRSIMPLP